MRFVALIAMLWLLAGPAYAVTVYVDPFTTPHSGHAGTIGDPYQTWTEPCAALNGIGGLILINPGTYIGAAGNALYTNNCSGVNGNPIIFRGNVTIPTNLPGAGISAPIINNTNSGGGFASRQIQIRFNTHDVEFQNIVVTGSTANISCIHFETDPSHAAINYRITYDHLTMSSCGCDSLYMQGGDYYTITNNVATNNGATCSAASVSGIHIYQPTNLDTAAGTHILISNNEVSGEGKGTGAQSDGNGIQVPDDGNGTQGGWCAAINAGGGGTCPYTGQVQVQNNIIYQNDGDGISYYSSVNPETIVNNTFYQNVQNQTAASVWGEITINTNFSPNVQAYNNIVVAKGATNRCFLAEGSGTTFTVTANANNNTGCTTAFTTSGSGAFSLGAGNNTGSPNLASPTTDFTPVAPSSAIGTANGSVAPSTNIFNNSRTGSGGVCTAVGNPNMGAI